MSSDSSPYTPPKAPLEDRLALRQHSMAKALTIGFAVAIGGGLLVSIPYLLVFGAVTGISVLSEESDALLTHSVSFNIGSLILGSLTNALGAYVAARTANRDPTRVGIYYAILMTLLGLLFLPIMLDDPWWSTLASFVLTPITALLGARLWRVQDRVSR